MYGITNFQERLNLVFFISVIMSFPTMSAEAQLSTEPSVVKEIEENVSAEGLDIDMRVPDIPATTVLGLTPTDVITPSSSRELVTSLLNATDRNGNFQTGIAIDVSALQLFGKNISLADYRYNHKKDWFSNAALLRSRVSLAVVKGVEDADDSTRLAFGFLFLPIDDGDPKLDPEIEKCYINFIEKTNKELKVLSPIEFAKSGLWDGTPPIAVDYSNYLASRENEIEDSLREKMKDLLNKDSGVIGKISGCNEDAVSRNTFKKRWAIGLAPNFFSKNGDTDELQWNGAAIWTSFTVNTDPFALTKAQKDQLFMGWIDGTAFNWTLHGRYTFDMKEANNRMPGMFPEQDSFLIGTKLGYGIPNFLISAEGVFISTDPNTMKDDDYYRYSISSDLKVMDNLWLALSFGSTFDRDNQGDEDFAFANLKWGFGDSPTLVDTN